LGDRAADAETRSLVRQANINRLATMDRVAREVTEADAQVRARGQEIELARQGVAAAIASQQRNGQRIQAGQGLPIEALQSNQALAQARREYLRTITDYNVAQFTLYRAVGWPGGDRR
jgi:outer membrane protein TolC